MKTKLLFVLLVSYFLSTSVSGQVKIGDNPNQINPSSLLELESNSKVLVITRVTNAEMLAITPLQGALVYNTTRNCVYQYTGITWVSLCDNGNGSGNNMVGITNLSLDSTCTTLSFNDQNNTPQSIDLACVVKNNETLTSIRLGNLPGEIIYTDENNVETQITITGTTGPQGRRGPAGVQGPPGNNGATGTNGINCWDTNGNGLNDPSEDINGDAIFNALDCRGADGNPSTDNQNISTNGTAGDISISGGNNISINIQDADADPRNEIQNITSSDGTVTIVPSATGDDFDISVITPTNNDISVVTPQAQAGSLTSRTIATHEADGTTENIEESITTLEQNTSTGVITYTNENGTEETANVVSTDNPGGVRPNAIQVGSDGGAYLYAPITCAMGRVMGNAIPSFIFGATTTRVSGDTTGDYQITFNNPIASSNYVVQLTVMDCSGNCPPAGGPNYDDPGISYYDIQPTGFKVNVGDSDNGSNGKVDIDHEFMFTVMKLPSNNSSVSPTGTNIDAITTINSFNDATTFQIGANVSSGPTPLNYEVFIQNTPYSTITITSPGVTITSSQNVDLTYNHVLTGTSGFNGFSISDSTPSPAGSNNSLPIAAPTTISVFRIP